MKWIYLSPHLDDAVFSCGGLIWEQTKAGDQVEIWTVFAGDPPDEIFSPLAIELHQEWGLSGQMLEARREEDRNSCQILGVTTRYLPYPDCIYRKSTRGEFYYQSEEDIFGGIHPEELSLIDTLVADLTDLLPVDAIIVAPLGIGNHIDHDITRKVVSRLEVDTAYYADYPYVRDAEGKEILAMLMGSLDWDKKVYEISNEGFNKWQSAALAYTSQTPVFWEDGHQLLREIKEISDEMGGAALWKTVDTN